MIRIILFLTVIILLFNNSKAIPQDTISPKYFPLKTGNAWYYKTTYFPIPFPPVFHKEHIEKDTIINGKKYFKYFQRFDFHFIRIDTVNGNLLAFSSGNGCFPYPNDKKIDSLASSPGDQIYCYYQSTFVRTCESSGFEKVFGYNTETKIFSHDLFILTKVKYAKNFGVINFCSGEPPPCSEFTNLMGCKIDGVVYGDTTLTGVNQSSSIVPEDLSLSQNYPNPFNPKTMINYSIPTTQYTILKVFDALGKEVATLVNEKQNAGSYGVEFNGEGLPSGIYFYKLEAGDFVETQRMILLK